MSLYKYESKNGSGLIRLELDVVDIIFVTVKNRIDLLLQLL